MKLKLNFKVNPYYLLISCFVYFIQMNWDGKYKFLGLEKYLNKYKNFMFKNFRFTIFTQINNDQDLKQVFKDTENVFKKFKQSKQFQKFLKETEDYCQWLENEWNTKKDIVLKNLEEITGLNIINEKLNIDVFVVHPKIAYGFNVASLNTIVWGHTEDWPNYSIVYLCHELLHILTYKKYKDPKLIHALIELATDNELRIRLNGGKYPPFVGHQNLEKIKKKILPFWKKYLNKKLKIRNIIELEKYILRNKIE